ncbi:SGNH hydrolase domain-containing protein [Ruania zhangjianzhongii]|uniref:SGNH hydrolase domain-containing protein n=1 Tax=Ruania zhangjianzhongii TaxID=2603206 RepID=UPI0011CC78F1|nr:SGNH hydrolase domain-containing protein [Ruania zhangjianzhongii]
MTDRRTPGSRAATATRFASPALRWSLTGNVALVLATAFLLALVLTGPPTQAPAETANAPGAEALDRDGEAVDEDPPGSLEALRDVAWFIPDTDDARYDMPRGYEYGCEQNQEDAEALRCDFGDPDGEITVAMVGDSKILQWQSAVATLARENSWRVRSYTKSNCGLHAGLQTNHGEPYLNCRAWNEDVLTDLLADPPDVVLVSNYVNTALDISEELAETQAAMVSALATSWRQLEEAGSAVVVILDNPSPGEQTVYECVAAHLNDLRPCAFDRADGIARSGQPAQLAAADEVPGVRTVDLTDSICPEEQCVPVIGNVLVYRQGSHLTDSYVRTLTRPLGRQLVPIVAESTAQGGPEGG